MKRSDELLKKIATQYVEQYGEQLERERELLDQHSPQYATPDFDARVAREQKARKRRGALRVWGAAAVACLVLLLAIPRLLPQSGEQASEAPGQSATASPLPISFTMAKNFTVSHMEQDQEKTVYYLANSQLDDVVMTLELEAGAPEYEYDELHELEISGKKVYGRYRSDYSILSFDHEGIRYTLTCRHDFQTLAELGKSILM